MRAFNREALKHAISGTVCRIFNAQRSELDLHRNTLDCFSASIDAVVQGISLDQWMIQERERQKQKTKQNQIGSLHEDIMGSIPGVVKLDVGNVIDIISEQKMLIAEVKNKHNTTKGNHKVAIYDDLSDTLKRYPGYTAYYVEVLPKGKARYDKPFTPSDNKSHTQRPVNRNIRVIDGFSFYSLLTGCDDALEELYKSLPELVSEIVYENFDERIDPNNVLRSEAFTVNYDSVYGKK